MLKLVEKQLIFNKGYVELWDFSQGSVKEIVCKVASLSYGRDNAKNCDKLYDKLIELGHESPFEFYRYAIRLGLDVAVLNYRDHSLPCKCYKVLPHKDFIATFKLKIPLFCARQIMRHRRFSYLEQSKRYTKDIPDFYIAETEKEYIKAISDDDFYYRLIKNKFAKEYSERLSKYKPEVARFDLPLRMYTQLWVQGDYKAYAYLFIERLQKEAQYETRLIAEIMYKLIEKHQPNLARNIRTYIMSYYIKHHIFSEARKRKVKKLWEGLH